MLAQFNDEAVTSVDGIVQRHMPMRPAAVTRVRRCVGLVGDLQFMFSNVFVDHLQGYLRNVEVLFYAPFEELQLLT